MVIKAIDMAMIKPRTNSGIRRLIQLPLVCNGVSYMSFLTTKTIRQ